MITTIEKNGIIIASFSQNVTRLNLSIAMDIKKDLIGLFDGGNKKVIISFRGIRYIDSSGFAVLLSALKTSKSTGGTLKLCDISYEIMDLIKLMQLHNIFDINKDVDEAAGSF